MFHSVHHLVMQARLSLAHQGRNGSAGGILDLGYSCATTSTCFLHRERLLAPNAISSTVHTCVLEGTCAHVHPGAPSEHKDFSAYLSSQMIICEIQFGAQFPLL